MIYEIDVKFVMQGDTYEGVERFIMKYLSDIYGYTDRNLAWAVTKGAAVGHDDWEECQK